jgi:hypothetical protein
MGGRQRLTPAKRQPQRRVVRERHRRDRSVLGRSDQQVLPRAPQVFHRDEVRPKTDKAGKRHYPEVGTATVHPGKPEGSLVLYWLDDALTLAEVEPQPGAGERNFTVLKARPAQGDEARPRKVGRLILREGGENGVLFLNWHDGEFAVFERKSVQGAARKGGKDARPQA